MKIFIYFQKVYPLKAYTWGPWISGRESLISSKFIGDVSNPLFNMNKYDRNWIQW